MLTPEQWNEIGKQAEIIYSQLELEIIQEIAERIANVGYANTVVLNDIAIAQEMGLMYEDIIKLVAEYNESSLRKVKSIFENAGIKSLDYDDNIYKLAGLSPIPLKQSKAMWELLEATALKTNNNLKNLVMTTASSTQTQFYNAMNNAYMEVSTGVKSYSQSIIDLIKTLSQEGSYIYYPSGRRMSLESAVRMNIVTSVNQTCGKLQEMRADEMNWDLMEITAHSGARPEHAEWQGKIVSRSGKNKKYLTLENIGYGEVTGFKGVNCRHDWMPFYEGSTKTYTDKELEELKNQTVVYNGKTFSKYEASQIQRRMERQIRQDKKDIAGLQGILTSKTANNKLIEEARKDFAKKSLIYKNHQSQLISLTNQINSKIDNTRLITSNRFNKNVSIQIANVTKLANKFNNSDIVGTKVNNTIISKIGEHVISQSYAREISVENIRDTLNNPVKFGIIRKDKSQQIKGETCTVVINTETGKLITTYSKKTRRE